MHRLALLASLAALLAPPAVHAELITVLGPASCQRAAALLQQGRPVTLRITGKRAAAIGEHLSKAGGLAIQGRYAAFTAPLQLLHDAFGTAATSISCAVSGVAAGPWLLTGGYRLSIRHDRNGPSVDDDELRMRFTRS